MNLTTEQLTYIEQRLANDKKSGVVAYACGFLLVGSAHTDFTLVKTK